MGFSPLLTNSPFPFFSDNTNRNSAATSPTGTFRPLPPFHTPNRHLAALWGGKTSLQSDSPHLRWPWCKLPLNFLPKLQRSLSVLWHIEDSPRPKILCQAHLHPSLTGLAPNFLTFLAQFNSQHLHCLTSQPLNLLHHLPRRHVDNQPVPCSAQVIRIPQQRDLVRHLQHYTLGTPTPNGRVNHHPAEFRCLDRGNHILVEHA